MIPIDTSLNHSRFQPIDIKIDFQNPCWAKNTEEHSIRVILEKENEFQEMECQIYDLEHVDDNTITSCSLVFLVPEDADGK